MPAQKRRLRLRTFGSRAVESHISPTEGEIWGTLLCGKETFRAKQFPRVCLESLAYGRKTRSMTEFHEAVLGSCFTGHVRLAVVRSPAAYNSGKRLRSDANYRANGRKRHEHCILVTGKFLARRAWRQAAQAFCQRYKWAALHSRREDQEVYDLSKLQWQ